MKPFASIFTELKKAGITENEDRWALVKEFSGGRTSSLKDLTPAELQQLSIFLRSKNHSEKKTEKPPKQKNSNEERNPMRNYIRHLGHLMGFVDTLPDGKKDYSRLDRFIQNIGSRNPHKKILNYLWFDELQAVCTQMEEMYRKELTKLNQNTKDYQITEARKKYGIK